MRSKLPQGVPDADTLEAFKGEELLSVSQALHEVWTVGVPASASLYACCSVHIVLSLVCLVVLQQSVF